MIDSDSLQITNSVYVWGAGATVSDAKTATEFNRITATEDIEKPIFKGKWFF